MAVYHNDHDPAACAWLRELITAGCLPEGEVDTRSILEVEPRDLRGFTQCHFFAGIGGWPCALRLAGMPDDQPVWTGSPPCQPFSQAGQRKGQDDDRHLAPAFLGLVAACRPGLVFGEQVASAAVLVPVGGAARGAAAVTSDWASFDALADALEAASYAGAAADLPAAGIGAPHIRQRLFFGAVALDAAAGGLGDGFGADHEDGKECAAIPINALLGRQVWLADWPKPKARTPALPGPALPGRARRTASGVILTGCSAGMESGDPLSPEHSRWLMGYPAAWGSCGATAMRSCRRSRRNS
jgi:site-specific DNA-cytosine methylase